ncbi:UNVERIFIED_CONTAM: hypothetical protein K2H54_045366 [Gekko kuhli]
MEEPIYEEIKPVASEGSEPVKEVDAEEEEEEEWEGCVQNLVEDLEAEGLYWNLIAALIEICHKPVQENCCAHCGEIAYYQECNWLRKAAVKETSEKSGQDEEEEEEDAEPRVCAEHFIEGIGRVQNYSEVAKTFPGKADWLCCKHCRLLSYCQESDGESGSSEDSDSEEESRTSEESGVESEPDASGGVKEQPPS